MKYFLIISFLALFGAGCQKHKVQSVERPQIYGASTWRDVFTNTTTKPFNVYRLFVGSINRMSITKDRFTIWNDDGFGEIFSTTTQAMIKMLEEITGASTTAKLPEQPCSKPGAWFDFSGGYCA